MKSKLDKQSLLAGITFIMLVCLMVIQFLFLLKSAKLEEEHFNHRVVLALREARNEIAREANKCNQMNNYVCGKKCPVEILYINFQKADSIISSNLAIHKIELDYTFEFINEEKGEKKKLCVTCYEQSLNGLLEQNGIKLHIKFPDGSQFIYAQVGTLFYISIGVIIFVMISFIFTSKLFRREKKMVRSIKYFIDNLVHEFQTPIANIRFATNLTIKKIDSNTEINKLKNYTQLIKEENNKIERYVGDILKVASMHNNNIKSSNVNVHELISNCIYDYKNTIENLNGEFHINLSAQNHHIKAVKEYIQHAICNLFDNAIKYSPSNPSITINTYNNKGKIYISIIDKGLGISPKHHQNIFEKYFRVGNGNIHEIKGFGLGLHFVKNVVNKYKGSIKVESKLNKGSTFTLIFKISNQSNEFEN